MDKKRFILSLEDQDKNDSDESSEDDQNDEENYTNNAMTLTSTSHTKKKESLLGELFEFNPLTIYQEEING